MLYNNVWTSCSVRWDVCREWMAPPRGTSVLLLVHQHFWAMGSCWHSTCVHDHSPVGHYKWFSLKLYESCFQNYTFLNESLVQFSRVDSTAREIQHLQQSSSSRAGAVLCFDFFTFSRHTGGQNSHQWFSDTLYDSLLDTFRPLLRSNTLTVVCKSYLRYAHKSLLRVLNHRI